MNRLTTSDYWRAYYEKSLTDRSNIERICSRYDRFWDRLIKENDANPPRTIIEIGGFPGRYMAYISSKYNLAPTILDFNPEREKVDETMRSFGVKDYNVIQADFLTYEPARQYDIVISIGFIEHFENYQEVLDKHVSYLKKGGTLFLLIPNKRYLRKWYGLLVDRENLLMHNLSCMTRKTFDEFEERNSLQCLDFTFYGGFQYAYHGTVNYIQLTLYRVTRLVFKILNPILEKYPNRFVSSVIIGIYKK